MGWDPEPYLSDCTPVQIRLLESLAATISKGTSSLSFFLHTHREQRQDSKGSSLGRQDSSMALIRGSFLVCHSSCPQAWKLVRVVIVPAATLLMWGYRSHISSCQAQDVPGGPEKLKTAVLGDRGEHPYVQPTGWWQGGPVRFHWLCNGAILLYSHQSVETGPPAKDCQQTTYHTNCYSPSVSLLRVRHSCRQWREWTSVTCFRLGGGYSEAATLFLYLWMNMIYTSTHSNQSSVILGWGLNPRGYCISILTPALPTIPSSFFPAPAMHSKLLFSWTNFTGVGGRSSSERNQSSGWARN